MVELLAATALATFLMTAVLGVLQSVVRQQNQLLPDSAVQSWEARLTDRLEWDLHNSQTFRVIPDGIELIGFASEDPISQSPLHIPTTVRYEIISDKKQSWLIRKEIPSITTQSQESPARLICCDAARIIFAGQASGSLDTFNDGTPKGLANGTIPSRLSVLVYANNSQKPMFQHDFVLH